MAGLVVWHRKQADSSEKMPQRTVLRLVNRLTLEHQKVIEAFFVVVVAVVQHKKRLRISQGWGTV